MATPRDTVLGEYDLQDKVPYSQSHCNAAHWRPGWVVDEPLCGVASPFVQVSFQSVWQPHPAIAGRDQGGSIFPRWGNESTTWTREFCPYRRGKETVGGDATAGGTAIQGKIEEYVYAYNKYKPQQISSQVDIPEDTDRYVFLGSPNVLGKPRQSVRANAKSRTPKWRKSVQETDL